MKSPLALFIVLAMLLGIGTGWACHTYLPTEQSAEAVKAFDLLTSIFLHLIKMVIAPLVLTTLIVGIGHMESAATVGRIGAKTLAWFLFASIVSLALGFVMVEWLKPGGGLSEHVGQNMQVAGVTSGRFTLDGFIDHLLPSSIIAAMAENNILQIVVFAVFVGTAVTMVADRAPDLMRLMEQAADIMLKVTGLVMAFAPVAIFGALASAVAKEGLGVLLVYMQFVGGFYLSLGILWSLLLVVAVVVMRGQALRLVSTIWGAVLLTFSTASSEASYPRLLEVLPKIGIPRRIVSFVLPLGYSFNLDGSMMYCTFAILFIAQAHHLQFTSMQLVTLLLLLLVTSKGIAGVPRASLVVVMATLSYMGLPESWIALVLAVDHILDMGRSATNVVGNSVAAAVIARWEGVLLPTVVDGKTDMNEGN